jgi:tRNA G10  N-methylase Trm11
MEYLIRFVQLHETFRKPEITALAELASINIEFLSYLEDVSHQSLCYLRRQLVEYIFNCMGVSYNLTFCSLHFASFA